MSDEQKNEETKLEADIDMTRDEVCPDGEDCTDDQVCPDGENCCPDGCGCFPAEVPFECITSMVSIIREGQIVERKLELLRHGAWAVGCLAALTEGMVGADEECPDGICPPETSQKIEDARQDSIGMTIETLADAIDEKCEGTNCDPGTVSANTKFLSPELIGLILQLIQLIARR